MIQQSHQGSVRHVRVKVGDLSGEPLPDALLKASAILAATFKKALPTNIGSKDFFKVFISCNDSKIESRWHSVESKLNFVSISNLMLSRKLDMGSLMFHVVYKSVNLYGGRKKHNKPSSMHELDEDDFACRKKSTIDPIPKSAKEWEVPGWARECCLPLALLIAKYMVDHPELGAREHLKYRTRKSPRLDELKNLLASVSLKPEDGPFQMDECAKFQAYFGDEYQVNCFVTGRDVPKEYGPREGKQLNLYLTDGHAYVIKRVLAFVCPLNSGKKPQEWCSLCKKTYSLISDHRCGTSSCSLCSLSSCINTKKSKFFKDCVKCESCELTYFSELCLLAHRKQTKCEGRKICQGCLDMVSKGSKHQCGVKMCRNCKLEQKFDHKCVMFSGARPRPFKKEMFRWYFDTETYPGENGEHHANLIVVQSSSGEKQFEYSGAGAAKQFVDDLQRKGSPFSDSYMIAFNLGYDGMFVHKEYVKRGITPNAIYNNNKIMSMEPSVNGVVFRDAARFIPNTRLAALPEMFGLEGEAKGMFPYDLNREEYLGKGDFGEVVDGVLRRFPSKKWFPEQQMGKKELGKFAMWWGGEDSRFAKDPSLRYNVYRELLTYCISDVRILRLAFEMFIASREAEFPGVEVLEMMTLPSYNNRVWRELYLKEEVALLPPQGYRESTSKECLVWLDYQKRHWGLTQLRHARNSLEVKIGGHKVDGYGVDASGQTYVFQYHGCWTHGCRHCFTQRDEERDSALEWTLYRDQRLKDLSARGDSEFGGFIFVSSWGCEWSLLRACDGDVGRRASQFEKSIRHGEGKRLNPRDSMRGGKTSVFKHFVETPQGSPHRLVYLDFTSHYPAINASIHGELFPIGHPEILLGLEVEDKFGDVASTIVKEELFGLIQCQVNPPKRVLHPILGIKLNNKLLFPLCGRCAVETKQESCGHSETQRRLEGCWTSMELKRALEMDYTLASVFEVWHWRGEQRSATLFKEFIWKLYLEKEYATGFPEGMGEGEKIAYVHKLQDQMGNNVTVDVNKFEYNPGNRAQAKFQINNFWGYFGKSGNPTTKEFVKTAEELLKYIEDPNIVITDEHMTEDYSLLTYKAIVEPIGSKTSVVLASFTTAYGRLHLNSVLEAYPRQSVYCDTDSVVLLLGEGDELPADATGAFGYLKDEVGDKWGPGATIDSFYCIAPKCYAFTVRKADGTVVTGCIKTKGFKSNQTTLKLATPESFKRMLQDRQPLQIPDQMQFLTNVREQSIRTLYLTKTLGFTSNKRRILFGTHCLDTRPFGYVD